MSVNISKNALDSANSSDLTGKKGTKQALTRLSSGVSLPEMQAAELIHPNLQWTRALSVLMR